jgi:simple sugar transport system ATP-binding protein
LSRHATDGKAFVGTGGMVKSGAIYSAAQRIIEAMDVRKSAPGSEAAALSGGNLQKFIVGRELDRRPSVMVVNQPTWGVDAGAAARIRQALIELARSALLFWSSARISTNCSRDIGRGRGNAQWRIVQAPADSRSHF